MEKITDSGEIERAAAYFSDKLKEHSCPVCKSNKWVMPQAIFEVRQFFGGNMKIGGGAQVIPMAIVTCHVCGYSMFFNAINIGAIKPKGE